MFDPAMLSGPDLAAGRPETGPAHALGLGVHVARMDEGGRGAIAKRAEALTEVLRGLQGATPDPAERLRMARHLAQVTPGLGLRPEDISLRDVTDTGVAGHIASVTGLRQALAAAAQPRYVGPLHEANPSTQGGVRYLGPAR
ncbi:MAG: hypothetical protein JWO83_4521 [Caulobacteraceae bacterium]|nr:hypothetical protein [Caulobacteraceae bacterium]